MIGDKLKFLSWAPIVFVSAKTGQGLNALLDAAERRAASQQDADHHRPAQPHGGRGRPALPPKATKGNKEVKVLFGTQIGVAPPTFALSLNHPVDLHFSYKRYLENQIRETFGLRGHPARHQGPHAAALIEPRFSLDMRPRGLIYSLNFFPVSPCSSLRFWHRSRARRRRP